MDKLDELVNKLVALGDSHWDFCGYAKWRVSVGETEILLLNTHTSDISLYVNRVKMELEPHQQTLLNRMCHGHHQHARDMVLERAMADLRTLG